MKRRIFLVCLFYCFFRLPIYESIAAIFWLSVGYVLYDLFTYFHDFWSQIRVVILVTPKQEMQVVLRRDFFSL